MRKLFLFGLSLAVLSNAGAQAQTKTNSRTRFENLREFKMPTQLPNPDFFAPIQSGSGSEKSIQLTYSPLFFTHNNAQFSFFTPNTNPIAYDAASKTLAIVELQTLRSSLATRAILRTSSNNGTSWIFRDTLAKSSTDFWGHPQLGIANPTGGTGFASNNFLLMCSRFILNQDEMYVRKGATVHVKIANDKADLTNDHGGPESDNPQILSWGEGTLSSFKSANKAGYTMGNILASGDGSNTHGQYGALAINSTLDNPEDQYTGLPSAWEVSQFKQSDISHYNGPMYTGVDPQSNIYAAITSLFASDDRRAIAVSKSVDFGQTWTSFAKVPTDLFKQYAESHGAADAFQYQKSAYTQDAFVVTGVDQYSYFLVLALATSDNNLAALHLSEVSYKDGAWSITKVSDIAGVPDVFIPQDSIRQARNSKDLITALVTNPAGNEIQVAKTADGKHLVLKWIDYNLDHGPIVLSPAQQCLIQNSNNQLEDVTIDTMFTTDVYLAFRPIEGGEWSTSNVTNDKVFNKGTKMPETVPSVSVVPFIECRSLTDKQLTDSFTPSEAITAYINAPDRFFEAIPYFYQIVNSTRAAIVVSVEDETNPTSATNFTLNAPKPSPANGETEITFNASNGGTVRLAVVNTLGVEVATLFNSAVQQGTYGVTFNTNDIPSGAYYITLTVNGVTQTRPLVVVR